MKTKSVLIVGLFCVFMVVAVAVSAMAQQGRMSVPLGSFSIDPPVEGKRSPVQFPHSAHFGYSCKQCHHKWNAEEPIVGCMTQGCHDLTQPAKKNDDLESDPSLKLRYFKNAFHKQCIGCHRQIKLANKKFEMTKAGIEGQLPATGPTGCKGCHLPE